MICWCVDCDFTVGEDTRIWFYSGQGRFAKVWIFRKCKYFAGTFVKDIITAKAQGTAAIAVSGVGYRIC